MALAFSARDVARQTNTAIVILRDGEIVEERNFDEDEPPRADVVHDR